MFSVLATTPPARASTIEYVVIGVYLLLLIFASALFRGMNRNVSDYFKSGSQGSWWLVGMSLFISGISAHTFTGNAGAIFEAGWSPLAFYLGNTLAFLINAAGIAALFRQTRAVTYAEVVEQRFGRVTQQVYAYTGVLFSIMVGAMWLYGLSIFCSTVFGFPMRETIVVLAVVVVGLATFGGSWAVMSSEFVQGLILVSITLLVAWLCLDRLGGIGAFIDGISAAPLAKQYALVKPAGQHPDGQYALGWFVAVLLVQISTQVSLGAAPRFFAAKDGREAGRAALLGAGLMGVMSLVWFIPPMAAKLLFASEVGSVQGLSKPAEAAFAIASIHLLPEGLSGLMVVAMCAATMSSMDTALNRNAAMLVRDIMPPLRRLLGWVPATDVQQLKYAKIGTALLGACVTVVCLRFASARDSGGVFELALRLSAVFGLPLTIPLLLGMWIKRVPWWAALVSLGFGALPAGAQQLRDFLPDVEALAWLRLTWTQQVFWSFGLGTAAFFACMPFYGRSGADYMRQAADFFERMHRPVDFAAEVGVANDGLQLRRLGGAAAVLALCVCPLLWLTENDIRRWGLVGVIAVNLLIGVGMFWAGRRSGR